MRGKGRFARMNLRACAVLSFCRAFRGWFVCGGVALPFFCSSLVCACDKQTDVYTADWLYWWAGICECVCTRRPRCLGLEIWVNNILTWETINTLSRINRREGARDAPRLIPVDVEKWSAVAFFLFLREGELGCRGD